MRTTFGLPVCICTDNSFDTWFCIHKFSSCLVLLYIKFGNEDGRKTFQYAKYNLVLCFCLYTCDSLNFIIKSFLIKMQKYIEINWIKIELETQPKPEKRINMKSGVPVLNAINISNMIRNNFVSVYYKIYFYWISYCKKENQFSKQKLQMNFSLHTYR